MTNGSERLGRDVAALSAMADEMAAYLDSDILFWPLSRSGMPSLTLGGYLMREHRLQALRDQLSAGQQAQLDNAVSSYNQTLAERIVRFETKANHELGARLRQWEEYLKDVDRGSADKASNYDTGVETRVMIAALIDRLSMPPYRLEERAVSHLALLDDRLRNRFARGPFVWPEAWEPAYPAAAYWWLYGAPRVKENAYD